MKGFPASEFASSRWHGVCAAYFARRRTGAIGAEGRLADGRSDGLSLRRRRELQLRRMHDMRPGIREHLAQGRVRGELRRLCIGAGARAGLAAIGSRRLRIRRDRVHRLLLRRRGDFVRLVAGTGCIVTIRGRRLRHRHRHALHRHRRRDRGARSVEDQGQAEQHPEQDRKHGDVLYRQSRRYKPMVDEPGKRHAPAPVPGSRALIAHPSEGRASGDA